MSEIVKFIGVAEFMREVHLERGNFSKFEGYDPTNKIWVEGDVWDFRRSDLSWWFMGHELEQDVAAAVEREGDKLEEDLEYTKIGVIRLTRYPDLEANLGVDNTYHPSVSSWKIDTEKIEQFFAGEFDPASN